jgi:hypothetical protein
MIKLKRIELLAAELFSYSLDNYADHIEIGNVRFTKLMPNDVKALLTAEKENWTEDQISKALEIEISQVRDYLERFKIAKKIVNAINPSESFRYAVKQSIKYAIEDGLNTEEDIDNLVIQICYKAADLGYLLELESKKLSDYSEWLRRDKNADYTGVGLPNLE